MKLNEAIIINKKPKKLTEHFFNLIHLEKILELADDYGYKVRNVTMDDIVIFEKIQT
jgi:hypothetical protein